MITVLFGNPLDCIRQYISMHRHPRHHHLHLCDQRSRPSMCSEVDVVGHVVQKLYDTPTTVTYKIISRTSQRNIYCPLLNRMQLTFTAWVQSLKIGDDGRGNTHIVPMFSENLSKTTTHYYYKTFCPMVVICQVLRL